MRILIAIMILGGLCIIQIDEFIEGYHLEMGESIAKLVKKK